MVDADVSLGVVDNGIGLGSGGGRWAAWQRAGDCALGDRYADAQAPIVIMRTRHAPLIVIDAKPPSPNGVVGWDLLASTRDVGPIIGARECDINRSPHLFFADPRSRIKS